MRVQRKKILSGFICLLVMVCFVSADAQQGPSWIGAFFVKGKVGLKWQDMDGITSFSVYRKASGEEYVKLIGVDKTHYFDTDLVPGTVYYYKIAVVGADGSEFFSSEKSVAIPGGDKGSFEPPVWVGLRVDRNTIFLNWDNVPGSMAYNVYRSTTSGSGYSVVGTSTASKHGDKQDLERGIVYYYVLTALNEEFEETEQSEELSIKFGMSAEEMAAAEAAATKIELEDIVLTYLFEIKTAGDQGDMNQPADVFVNSKGNIYVTDALNFQVNCYDPSGKHLFSFGELTADGDLEDPPGGTFSYPFTLFIDSKDEVYVSDVKNNDIQVFTPEGKFLRRIVAKIADGEEKFRPNGLHVFDDGRIVTTDTGNHRFLIIDQQGNILLSKGTRGAGDGEFTFPDELTVTNENIICIVDVINCRVQEFDLEGNFIRAFGEVGQTVGTFGRPKGITVGEDGRLWVSDGMANAVQIFTIEGEIKSTVVKFEKESIFLATPRGIYVKDGRFYVVNRLPHQVLVFKIG